MAWLATTTLWWYYYVFNPKVVSRDTGANGVNDRELIRFGDFVLDVQDARLIGPDGPVHVGNKAIGVLEALINGGGRLLTKDALFETVWDGTIVSESALTSVIKELRRALGDTGKPTRFIESVYGRGYRFVARIEAIGTGKPIARGDALLSNLPAKRKLVGRADAVTAIASRLQDNGCLTIVGSGGVGKTQVAIEAARLLQDRFKDGVWLVEMAGLTSANEVPEAVAKVLALELTVTGETIVALIDRLRRRECLILLDNAEHLADGVAALVEAIRAAARGVTLLITSQEPLAVAVEYVYRLTPLPLEEAQALFVERARAADQTFIADAATSSTIAAVCERLDGLPLAIEMAAAHSSTLGCASILAKLDDGFSLLVNGRRTAVPRQQTLQATIDWSHGLLTSRDQTVFRRLGVFGAEFSLDAAKAIVSGADITPDDVAASLAILVAKSLIVARPHGGSRRFRLLHTIASFARAKLVEADEDRHLRRFHAKWFAGFVAPIWSEFVGTASDTEILEIYRIELASIEDATRWSYGPEGDPEIGHCLVAGSASLWGDRTLRSQVEIALSLVTRDTPAYVRARLLGARAHVTMRLDPARAILLADEAIAATRATTNDGWALADVMSSKGFALWLTGQAAEAKKISAEIATIVPLDRPSRIGALATGLAACVRLSEAGPEAAQPLFDGAITALRSIGAHGLANFWQATAMRFDRATNLDGQIGAWRSLLVRIAPSDMYADELSRGAAVDLAMRLAVRGTKGDIDEAMRLVRRFFRTTAMTHEYRIFLPSALVALKSGRLEEGAIIYGFAQTAGRRAGEAAITAQDFDKVRAEVDAALSADDAARLTALGATLPHEKIVDLALGQMMAFGDSIAA